MGAGAVAAGVSAAMIAGADVASADTAAGSDASKSGTSTGSPDKRDRPGPRRSDDAGGSTSTDTSDTADQGDKGDKADKADKADQGDKADQRDKPGKRDRAKGATDHQDDTSGDGEPSAVTVDETPVVDATDPVAAAGPTAAPVTPTVEKAAPAQAELSGAVAASKVKAAGLKSVTTAAAPQRPTLQELAQSLLFDVIGVAVTFVSGPPVVPHGSKVIVRHSSLEIADGHTVPADWYYPDGDEPPQRMIYLQHGFLGVSAMYSYTAALLAERTNSVVVVPTLTSNRYVRDGFWLGDDQAHRATADLFVGNRDALTASALAAGYAKKYGVGVALPDSFVLVGHSLGGGLVAGAAGHYADAVLASGADNQLAGVILLDAALSQEAMSDSLDKLDGLGYIPVLELGAPKDVRRVDAALNEHRPGNFNGVVLTDGQHLDSMMGGTPFIQFVSHLYQGFPTRQNQLAAQTLIAGWANDIFAGRIDTSTGKCDGDDCAGIYGDLGETIFLETPAGPTSGVVIGATAPSPAPVPEFRPTPATALVAPVGKRVFVRV
jgi:pimeloyl-ACP methyl ester carboxylesterase